MKLSILFAAASLLGGCTASGDFSPKAQQIIGTACKIDGVVQPIAVSVVPVTLPQSAPAATLDVALLHPAVVQICAQLGGKPAAVTLSPAP